MNRIVPQILLAALCWSSAIAWAETPAKKPFHQGDPKIGKTLAEKSCARCHDQLYHGEGNKIYLRSNRRVQSAEQLLAQVRTCNTNVGANWFPDEEEHVAAYLNLNFYHFK